MVVVVLNIMIRSVAMVALYTYMYIILSYSDCTDTYNIMMMLSLNMVVIENKNFNNDDGRQITNYKYLNMFTLH